MTTELLDAGSRLLARPQSLGSRLAGLAQSERPVAFATAGSISGAKFSAAARGLAALLAMRPERAWALVAEDSVDFARGFFALAAAGKTILLPQGARPEAIAITGAEAILSDGRESAPELPRVALDGATMTDTTLADDFDPAAVAIGIHTSGSTAQPKRVTKTLAQLDAEIVALEAEWGSLLGDAPVIASVPHHHLYGLLVSLLWPLAAGRPILDFPAEFSARTADCVLVSSPAFLGRIARPEALRAFPPRAIFSSGAPLPAAAAIAIAETAGPAPIEIYGSTETGGIGWRARASAAETDAPWRRISGIELRFREEENGSRLLVRSPWTAGEWIATGDFAVALDDSRFRLAGRADGMIKLEDKRINPEELAAFLEEHELVHRARVIALDGASRRRLGAVVVPTPAGSRMLETEGKANFVARLDARLAERYERVLIPRKWRIVAALPVNAMGKIERARLAALFDGESA
ncbi:MAG TPA: class I adenylate-forming enzyme family protein [Gammaproteobacteria bacterium]|nr:class I adenylate-forming enzyme family protein [Gammaproteobacteria bacterium]